MTDNIQTADNAAAAPKKRARNAVYARKRRRGPASTNARAIRRAQRQAAVLKARLECRSFRDIGKELNISAPNAYRLCVEAMGELLPVEDLETIRKTELARLDRMQAAISAKAEAGDNQAINTALKIMERRAAYIGLDKVDPKQLSNDAASTGLELNLVFRPGLGDDGPTTPIIDHEPLRLPPPAFNPAAGARIGGFDPLVSKLEPQRKAELPQEQPQTALDPLSADGFLAMDPQQRRKLYGTGYDAVLRKRNHWMS
jgi:hypothetical protein